MDPTRSGSHDAAKHDDDTAGDGNTGDAGPVDDGSGSASHDASVNLQIPRWQRAYLTTCAGVIGFALAYALCDYARWPRLTYFPVEHEWKMLAMLPGPLPMAYVGTVLWGVGGAVCAASAAWLIAGFARRPIPDRWLQLSGGWALAAVVYAGLYYTWNLWPF